MEDILSRKASLVPWVTTRYSVNLMLCCIAYFFTNSLLCAAHNSWPERKLFLKQVTLSVVAMPAYALLPTIVESLALKNMTHLHAGAWHVSETVAFGAAVEVLVYGIHRLLHENLWLYKRIHKKHHEYKSENQLSPFASFAFAPLDGLLQACPYALLVFILPCHLAVWELMLFCTGVWSSCIHLPKMFESQFLLSSKHHTLHHTESRCNYGQYFKMCDYLFGTLRNNIRNNIHKTKTD